MKEGSEHSYTWLCEYERPTNQWKYYRPVAMICTYLKRMKGMGSTRYYFARRRVGEKEPDPLERKKKMNLKIVQEMPDQKIIYPAGRAKEERSYIHLVSPSHTTSRPPPLFGWPGGLDGNLGAV